MADSKCTELKSMAIDVTYAQVEFDDEAPVVTAAVVSVAPVATAPAGVGARTRYLLLAIGLLIAAMIGAMLMHELDGGGRGRGREAGGGADARKPAPSSSPSAQPAPSPSPKPTVPVPSPSPHTTPLPTRHPPNPHQNGCYHLTESSAGQFGRTCQQTNDMSSCNLWNYPSGVCADQGYRHDCVGNYAIHFWTDDEHCAACTSPAPGAVPCSR